MGNYEKNATLGMPHGTACGKLRKILLFECLKRHNENTCVRCDKIIETVDELSIEHLKPWEGISAELFWDLTNIAFSHMACNRPHHNPTQKYFTTEDRAQARRERNARYMRNGYTTEKRRTKFRTTGH